MDIRPLTVDAGGSKTFVVTVYSDTSKTTLHPLAGYTAKMQVREKVGGIVFSELTSPSGGITINTLTSEITVTIPAADTATYEWPHFIKGYTSGANVATVVTGTNVTLSGNNHGNHTIVYQIDKGSGWNGSWTPFIQANIAAETGISATTGFKLKIKVTCNSASTTNAVTGIYCTFTTDTTSQQAQYPLDLANITLTGLNNPSEVRIFNANTTTEIAGAESVTSGTFSATVDKAAYTAVDIAILSLGYQNIRLLNLSTATDISAPIQQQLDRQYSNL